MSSYYERNIKGFPAKRDYWIKAKYDGHCKECESDIRAGENALYTDEREIYCETCGEEIKPR